MTRDARDGLDFNGPLPALPPAPRCESAEEELLRREAVARPYRHSRRHSRCRLPCNISVTFRTVIHFRSSYLLIQGVPSAGALGWGWVDFEWGFSAMFHRCLDAFAKLPSSLRTGNNLTTKRNQHS